MRPIDSCYDRACARAEFAADKIIARLEDGDLVEYEDMEALDDMANAMVRNAVDLEEVPGDGYRAKGEQWACHGRRAPP